MVDQQEAPEQNEDEQGKISPALEAFNRKVTIGVFQFLYEDSLPANLGQRRLLHFVADGFDNDYFRFYPRDRKKLLAH